MRRKERCHELYRWYHKIFLLTIFVIATSPNYRSDLIGKESPDNTEQPTGEEPGPDANREQTVPQKITALLPLPPWRGLG